MATLADEDTGHEAQCSSVLTARGAKDCPDQCVWQKGCQGLLETDPSTAPFQSCPPSPKSGGGERWR